MRRALSPWWRYVAQTGKPAQVEEMRKHLRNGLELGGLGIGVLLDYMTEAVSESELSMIFATAAEYDKPVYVHVRRACRATRPVSMR